MREYKRVVVSTATQKVSRVVCDLCTVESTNPNSLYPWGLHHFDVEEVEIKYKNGSSYPEGGSGQVYNIDICPKCFMERFIPWMESQGANIQPEEWDY